MNRQLEQWNKIESPETDPHIDGNTVHDKGNISNQWGKGGLFNKRC